MNEIPDACPEVVIRCRSENAVLKHSFAWKGCPFLADPAAHDRRAVIVARPLHQTHRTINFIQIHLKIHI